MEVSEEEGLEMLEKLESIRDNNEFITCPLENYCTNHGIDCPVCMYNREATPTDNFEGNEIINDLRNHGKLDDFIVS